MIIVIKLLLIYYKLIKINPLMLYFYHKIKIYDTLKQMIVENHVSNNLYQGDHDNVINKH